MNAPDNEAKDVKVSVCIITYNHERFVRQAIESVLMQEADFEYELVIGEDCSTDGTREIVVEYARQYPSRIRLLLPEHNQGMIPNFVATLTACRGQYVALLEGDDYWTDPHKLQTQVDFLEARPECAICFHIASNYENGVHTQPRALYWRKVSTIEDLLRRNYIQTSSVMFRNGLISEFPDWYFRMSLGDWPLFLLLAEHGKIGFLDGVMGAYRVHPAGVWSSRNNVDRLLVMVDSYRQLTEYFGERYSEAINRGLSREHVLLSSIYADLGDEANAKIHLHRSIRTCFSLRRRWIDQVVMWGRLYCPRLHRLVKWILKEGRFSPVRIMQAASTSRFYRTLRTAFCKSGSK